ncbi:acyl-coenzyme A synthetase/AMP-(fatty) acid ligase [Allocatelliglobosispora scoriae]|uniref:Acyl-coenzyme A synthetase/AMP-(Fatty) acid ligase n=1 Tax=Allocatelliglobosispora scoriae TaxID=643052 RepID=A0A841C0B6_9ACTN|nr:class I adenylate-forming enzyme family protein [Allocatelliglobosispora scoriae]MBB5872593.1 acyl-coenzyme A synthetase/AMP-(fatty) acid ligase [Allocatelliglobosispora scoriae]
MTTRNIRAILAADPELGAGNVVTRLLEHGEDPDGLGLTFDTDVDGHPAWQPLTLGRLDERVRARAAWYHQRGVRMRDPIAVWTTSAADVILNFMALNRLGAIPALLNGNLPAETAAEYIRRLRTSGVVVDARHAELLAGRDLGAPILGDVTEIGLADPADAPPTYRHHPDDPISITHSSGTTGMPKAIVHSHTSLFAATRRIRLSGPRAQGTERVLCALPAPHTAGILSVNQALCNRAELVFISSQRGPDVLAAIESWHPTGVFGFAVTWADMARFDLSKHDMDSVALWFNTGDCAHEAHIRPLVNVGSHNTVTREGVVRVAGSTFIDGIGSTEMGHSAFHIAHTKDSNRYQRCIGKPHVFADTAVLDPDGNPVPPGQVGHLGLKSPTLMLGCWNDSVTTFRTRLKGYYLTGDLVYTDTDGYYYHVDRAADSVELGNGAWLHTSWTEERVLATLPDVVDCTVVSGRIDGEVVTDVLLILRPDADPDADRSAEVRAALGEKAVHTLRDITIVPDSDIPTGATGKVRKLVLRERAAADAGSR